MMPIRAKEATSSGWAIGVGSEENALPSPTARVRPNPERIRVAEGNKGETLSVGEIQVQPAWWALCRAGGQATLDAALDAHAVAGRVGTSTAIQAETAQWHTCSVSSPNSKGPSEIAARLSQV